MPLSAQQRDLRGREADLAQHGVGVLAQVRGAGAQAPGRAQQLGHHTRHGDLAAVAGGLLSSMSRAW
jgi:hypothetical protein